VSKAKPKKKKSAKKARRIDDTLSRLQAFQAEFNAVCASWCLGDLTCKELVEKLLHLQGVVSYSLCEDRTLTDVEGMLESLRLKILDLRFASLEIVSDLLEIRSIAEEKLIRLQRICLGIYS